MQEKSKRIAKNTFMLYIRMVFMMFITFYTTRVILETLGVDDFGVYNVVGGFVAMFSMITGSLNAACTRFLNFAMGKNDLDYQKKVFSTEVSIQIIFAFIVFVLCETVGLWFLNNKLVIPADRLIAANWCYQFSIFNFCVGLTQTPYVASVIAHEKMGAFAFFSIWEAIFQLILSYLVTVSPIDKLIFYAALLWLNAWVMRSVYFIYCRKKFAECRYKFILDKQLTKEIFGFSGWNLIGASSWVLRNHGNNILLNLFFGPSVNAARAIGNKIHGTAMGFVNNFITALTPQITQSYASGDHEYMFKLIYKGSRLAYYMILFMAIPLIINTHYILNLWLVEVPDEAILFGQLAFIMSMASVLSNPLITAQLATGNIRNYQIIVGGLQMLNLPLSYLFLKLGCIPQIVVIIAIICEIICLTARIILLRKMIGLNARSYLNEVIFNVFKVTLCASIIPAILAFYTEESFVRLIYTTIVGVFFAGTSILFIGCSKEERLMIVSKIRSKVISKFSSND